LKETLPFKHVHLEIAFVRASISPFEIALAFFLPITEEPLEECSIWPCLIAHSMMHIHFPFAAIIAPIRVIIVTLPMRLSLAPLTIVNVAIGMNDSSPPLVLVLEPFALIHRAIEPDHDSEAVPDFASGNVIESLLTMLV
jgi:hypothetical protein